MRRAEAAGRAAGRACDGTTARRRPTRVARIAGSTRCFAAWSDVIARTARAMAKHDATLAAPMEKRRALAALALVVPLPSIGVLASMYVAPGPFGATVWALSKVAFVLAPLVWLLAVERGRPSLSPARHGGFGFGLASGIGLSLAVFGFWLAVGDRWIDGVELGRLVEANGIGTRGRFAAIALYTIFVNSLIEEYVWRWFVYSRFAKLVRPGVAVLLAASAFTVHHTLLLGAQFGWSFAAVASIGVLVAGGFWSWTYARYRSVWPGYLSHALVDTTLLAIGWRLIFG